MLSRRNIRVKVMQMLYSINRDAELSLKELVTRYHQGVSKSYEMYLYSIQHFIKVAEVSILDAGNRKTKLLPTDEDKKFTPKLYENKFIQSLVNHKGLQEQIKKYTIEARIDSDNVRMLYAEFSKSPIYKNFINQDNISDEDYLEVLLALYKFCYHEEVYEDLIESNYHWWIDDESLVIGVMKKTIKGLPYDPTNKFYEEYIPDDEAVTDFGELILKSVVTKDKELVELIEGFLVNWDPDRVAILDMICIKMAVCEMMYCPSIPTKVTINEYVEISKQYSTEKSKEFINGILDHLKNHLSEQGKIVKEGRGLIED